jgi:hypothetical protein
MPCREGAGAGKTSINTDTIWRDRFAVLVIALWVQLGDPGTGDIEERANAAQATLSGSAGSVAARHF